MKLFIIEGLSPDFYDSPFNYKFYINEDLANKECAQMRKLSEDLKHVTTLEAMKFLFGSDDWVFRGFEWEVRSVSTED